jgi:hypothetical protein
MNIDYAGHFALIRPLIPIILMSMPVDDMLFNTGSTLHGPYNPQSYWDAIFSYEFK